MRDLLDEDDNVIETENSSREENNKIRMKTQLTQSDIAYFKKTYATVNTIEDEDMIDFWKVLN